MNNKINYIKKAYIRELKKFVLVYEVSSKKERRQLINAIEKTFYNQNSFWYPTVSFFDIYKTKDLFDNLINKNE